MIRFTHGNPGRLLLVLASAVLVATAGALSIAIPPRGSTIVSVSRFGSSVRLLAPRPSFSFLPLARRIAVPYRSGLTRLAAPIPLRPGEPPARIVLLVGGTGRLPLSARDVRRLGWEGAVSAWISRALGSSLDGRTAYRASAAWRRIFPEDPPQSLEALRSRLAATLPGFELRDVKIEAEIGRVARQDLAARTAATGRLVVVGLDALDWRLIDQLAGRGGMPNLRRLVARGAQAVLDVPPPLISPVIWTTLATGAPPSRHGVLDFLETDPADGSSRPVGSSSRKVPALWEMTAAAGRSTAVIGWWATFPAEGSAACTVYSDRLTEQLIGLEADTPGAAAPAEAATVAQQLQLRPSAVTAEMLQPFAEVSNQELGAVRSGTASWDEPIGGLARLIASTTTVERLTSHELQRGTRVVFTYMEGTDTVGHLFAPYRPPVKAAIPSAMVNRFGGVVDRYYAEIDRWLGEISRQLGPHDRIVIVSDHGFTWGADRPPVASGAHTATAVWWHRPEGVFIAAGSGIAPTTSRQRIGVLDVAPAILALAGLPEGNDVSGSVPAWLGSAVAPQAAGPVNYAALLPRPAARYRPLPDAARQEEVAKLRALGYIGGSPAPGSGTGGTRTDARTLNNLGSTLFSEGRLPDAETALRRAIAADPTYAAPHHNLSLLFRKKGLLTDADREFWTAVDLGIADREMAVVRLALDYQERGDLARANTVFSEGRARFPDSAPIWLNSGVFLGEQGDYLRARTCLEHAVALNPANPSGYANLAAALSGLGDVNGARKALTTAARLDPRNASVRRELARLGGPLPR